MSWYYAENDARQGPIEDPAFQALVSAGTIKPTTLVWREGLADWVPYSQLTEGAAPPQPAAPALRATLSAQPAMGLQGCSQCGRNFPPDDMVSYEGRYICAGCKPAFFQRIKEGVAVAGSYEYAGFWIRFAAKFIDGIVINIGVNILGFFVGMAFSGGEMRDPMSVFLTLVVLAAVLRGAYEIFFVGKFGATPGKMACKLEVIRPDGSPMTYGRATGRYFAEWLSELTLGIGYLMAASDEEKRALHDRVADTRVVRKG